MKDLPPQVKGCPWTLEIQARAENGTLARTWLASADKQFVELVAALLVQDAKRYLKVRIVEWTSVHGMPRQINERETVGLH